MQDRPPIDLDPDFARDIYSEEELKDRYSVDFVRTPCGERVEFWNPVYKGVALMFNPSIESLYRAHIWLVYFTLVDNRQYHSAMEGILQITVTRWRNAGLPPAELAFRGRCAVVASPRKSIVSIYSNMEDWS